MGNSELIHNSRDDEIDHVAYVRRARVERRGSWKNYRACFSDTKHVGEVNCTQWCLAGNQYQLAAFFQRNVGRALDE